MELFIRKSQIEQSVLNSDIEAIEEYLNSNEKIHLLSIECLDPTYDFIDYITNDDNSTKKTQYIIPFIIIAILRCSDLDKISYFIDRLSKLYSKNKRVFSIIEFIMMMYNNRNKHSVTLQTTLYYKILMSIVVDNIKNYVTLNEIVDYINQLKGSLGGIITNDKLIRYDIMLYLVFQMINSNMLENIDNDTLEQLILLSLQMNVSDVLTEFLLKYYAGSKDLLQYYHNRIGEYNLPSSYNSLFSEDI